MSVDGLRRALALGLWVGGVSLLPLVPLVAWLGSRPGGAVGTVRRLIGLSTFVLTVWGVAAAACLLLAGYLLRPARRPWLRTRLSTLFRLAVGASLWLLGMVCLLGVLLVLVAQMLGLVSLPLHVSLHGNQLVLNVLLLHAPILVLGALFLLAARKWLHDTAPAKR
ncbi:MAG: hypothetical protein M5U01_41565 [Ardenticatenaceae bacterium]|nr:hypothetical protein [Ardenticatenaceae bacterium]